MGSRMNTLKIELPLSQKTSDKNTVHPNFQRLEISGQIKAKNIPFFTNSGTINSIIKLTWLDWAAEGCNFFFLFLLRTNGEISSIISLGFLFLFPCQNQTRSITNSPNLNPQKHPKFLNTQNPTKKAKEKHQILWIGIERRSRRVGYVNKTQILFIGLSSLIFFWLRPLPLSSFVFHNFLLRHLWVAAVFLIQNHLYLHRSRFLLGRCELTKRFLLWVDFTGEQYKRGVAGCVECRCSLTDSARRPFPMFLTATI